MSDIPCPFSPAPDDIITHSVPERLQAAIAELWLRRKTINRRPAAPIVRCGLWHSEMQPVVGAFETIENELRGLVDAPVRSCVEYYAGWRFRCPDYNTLHAEYMARLEKK